MSECGLPGHLHHYDRVKHQPDLACAANRVAVPCTCREGGHYYFTLACARCVDMVMRHELLCLCQLAENRDGTGDVYALMFSLDLMRQMRQYYGVSLKLDIRRYIVLNLLRMRQTRCARVFHP